MALPRKLKHLNLFLDGDNWIGVGRRVHPAKLAMKPEAYRGGVRYRVRPISTWASMMAPSIPNPPSAGYEAARSKSSIRPRLTAYAPLCGFLPARRHRPGLFGRNRPAWPHQRAGWRHSQNRRQHSSKRSALANTYYKVTVDGEELVEIDLINM